MFAEAVWAISDDAQPVTLNVGLFAGIDRRGQTLVLSKIRQKGLV